RPGSSYFYLPLLARRVIPVNGTFLFSLFVAKKSTQRASLVSYPSLPGLTRMESRARRNCVSQSACAALKERVGRPRGANLGQTNVLYALDTPGRDTAPSDQIRGRDDTTRIAVVGAFDRFNYGDLLFPIIIENALRYYGCHVQAEFYGLFKRDL